MKPDFKDSQGAQTDIITIIIKFNTATSHAQICMWDMWCACVQHAGNRMKSLSHCARVRWSSAADINASLSEPAKTLMTHVLWWFSRRQEKDAAPARVRQHVDERLNKTAASPPSSVSTLPTRLQPRVFAHVGVKRTQEASLPLGHFLDAVSISARVPHPPTTPPLWGLSICPWLPTLSNKTKMLQMEGQRARRCGGCKPWGPHFD